MVIIYILNGKLLTSAVVVLSHEDYPIKKLQEPVMMTYGELDNTVQIYESNVKDVKNRKYTTGGRVLSMVSIDNTIPEALQNIYNNIHKISYPGAYYRRDIGCNNPLTKLSQ